MKAKVLVASLATVGTVAAYAITLNAAQPAAAPGYADDIYADYARASSQQVTFEIREISSGPLKQLEGRSFADVVGMPSYHIEADDSPLALRNVRVKADPGVIDRHELDAGVEGFDAVGLPVDLGRYRILSVKASIKGVPRQHKAIEMCWDGQGHCVVFDPNIVFLDSIVNNQRLAKASGYRAHIEGGRSDAAGGGIGTQAVCGLASNPSWTWKQLTWGAWGVSYKDIFGITLARKDLGSQQSGIRCNASCYPAPYGYSNSSSGYGNLGYSVDCGWEHNSGVTGRTGKWVSETKCAHKLIGSARADVTLRGTGSGVSLAWDTNGGIDSNGGAFTDTCGYF